MCTAITFQSKDFYFGRNLDIDHSYQETVTITLRNYPLRFRNASLTSHLAMIGMAYIANGYPLYYEATNEAGLSAAGLNFPGNAVYAQPAEGKDNIATYELIPWILGKCRNLSEARILLDRLNITGESFSPELPPATLHWIIADKSGSVTVESVKDGLKIYDNPVGILTNNPPFDYQITNLANYMNLSADKPNNNFCKSLNLSPYSLGMGAMGLPGDLSSASRFVKAAFTKLNSTSGDSEYESVSQFFHIIKSVEQQRGCVHIGDGKYEVTLYSSCCNADKGIYYYTTYENSQITGIDMHRENLDGCQIISYPLILTQQINMMN